MSMFTKAMSKPICDIMKRKTDCKVYNVYPVWNGSNSLSDLHWFGIVFQNDKERTNVRFKVSTGVLNSVFWVYSNSKRAKRDSYFNYGWFLAHTGLRVPRGFTPHYDTTGMTSLDLLAILLAKLGGKKDEQTQQTLCSLGYTGFEFMD